MGPSYWDIEQWARERQARLQEEVARERALALLPAPSLASRARARLAKVVEPPVRTGRQDRGWALDRDILQTTVGVRR